MSASLIKLLMIGDTEVGKTCLLLKYADDTFPQTRSTVGVDFRVRQIEIDGKRVKLKIWDTAGQERFRTITVSYFRGAQGLVLVYDITVRKTFLSVRTWLEAIATNAKKDVKIVLIGNKCDMPNKREVTFEEGKKVADEFKIEFFETSAKENINIDESFMSIAKEIKSNMLEQDDDRSTATNTQILDFSNQGKQGTCC